MAGVSAHGNTRNIRYVEEHAPHVLVLIRHPFRERQRVGGFSR